MKKMSLLVLALAIVVLPGCRDKKKESTAQTARKNTVEKYMETDVEVDKIDLSDFDDMDDEDDDEEFDVDALLRDLNEDDDMADLSDEDLADMLDEYSDESQAFNWIDEQADDELRRLYFSFNHYGIRPDQKDSLAYDIEQVKQLVADSGTAQPTVVIEGHACQEGTPSYNIGLSEKRAKSVADLFVASGVDKNLIKVVGRGQECPILVEGKVVNGSREDRAPNRRVEVRVIYT
jgi:outer membrane protein OmpA-like peptidoglycan-associated protein